MAQLSAHCKRMTAGAKFAQPRRASALLARPGLEVALQGALGEGAVGEDLLDLLQRVVAVGAHGGSASKYC